MGVVGLESRLRGLAHGDGRRRATASSGTGADALDEAPRGGARSRVESAVRGGERASRVGTDALDLEGVRARYRTRSGVEVSVSTGWATGPRGGAGRTDDGRAQAAFLRTIDSRTLTWVMSSFSSSLRITRAGMPPASE